MAKQDDYARYTIRVPKEVYAAIESDAAENGRSLNAEIVERLAFSVEHPAEAWDNLMSQAQDLYKKLKENEEEYAALLRHAEVISTVSDQEFDYQLRLMYQVLNYLDEIPLDLAIWAYDIISAIEGKEFESQLRKNADLSSDEIRAIIRQRRETRRHEVFAKIKKHLNGQDDEA